MNSRGLLDQLLKSGQDLLQKQSGSNSGVGGGLSSLLTGAAQGLFGHGDGGFWLIGRPGWLPFIVMPSSYRRRIASA